MYVVATPIGNIRDITLRTLDLFQAADLVACEDTRVTGHLLHLHGIKAPLTPYHEHNADRVRPRLVQRIGAGEIVVLATDAGTPMISDPGLKLVRACLDANLHVDALPGASSVTNALVLSALPTDRFLFAGFPPVKDSARRQAIAEMFAIPATTVWFESPKRLARTLAAMAEADPDREAVVCREMTKFYQERRAERLAALASHYAEAGAPRGEVVLVVAPPEAGKAPAADDETVDDALRAALADQPMKDAARSVARRFGLSRRDVYQRALAIGRTDSDAAEEDATS